MTEQAGLVLVHESEITDKSSFEEFSERRWQWFIQEPYNPILFCVSTVWIVPNKTYFIKTRAYRRSI